MNVKTLVELLTEKVGEIGLLLPDLESPQAWEVGAAKRALPLMIRDVRAVLERPIDDAPGGFYLSLQMVVDSLDHAAEILDWSLGDRSAQGFAIIEGERLRKSLGFIQTYVETPSGAPATPAAETARQVTGAIPNDKRTKPMSKTEALKFIGWPAHAENERQAIDWLTQSIRDGEYRWEFINTKKGVYHIDDFPAECHKEISKV